jgi:hypothetical protein
MTFSVIKVGEPHCLFYSRKPLNVLGVIAARG